MRVLVVPEVYRREALSSNGTVNDAVSWVEEWLRRDPTLHVYWLLPSRGTVPYDREGVLADRRRVTLVEADPPMADADRPEMFTENGYSADQLAALRREVFERDAYVDVVVDQLRTGRFTLYKWLLEHADQWASAVRPFDVVANVHDLQVPFKYRGCSYRNDFQMYMELCGVTFADGVWFTAGVDADAYREYAGRVLRPGVVERTLDEAVEAGSPLAFDRFEERYSPEPEMLHVAGSLAEKKHADLVLDVAETLYERFGVETVMTSMEAIPPEYRAPGWVDARPHASRAAYERSLERGDLAVCASEYETMARTPFEQAASGQVLVLRDEPWVYDCIPGDYPFVGDPGDLPDLAAEAVEDWERAVAANRDLVEHVTAVRHPERCGRRTHGDLRRRVEEKRERYAEGDAGESPAPGKRPDVVSRTLDAFDADEVAVDDVVAGSASFTADGRPLTDRESYAFVDLVYTLRVLGYEDAGNPGTPVFRPRSDTD